MTFLRSIFLFLLLSSLPASPTDAAPGAKSPGEAAWSRAQLSNPAVTLARHRGFERRLERQRAALGPVVKSHPVVRSDGQIALIEDDGSLVFGPSPFDLSGTAMQFLRRPRGTSVVRSHLTLKQLIGERLDLGDDDSVRIDFPEDFRFPFFNRTYSSVFVNSNGNVTFEQSGSGAWFPSVDEMLEGPPRIAPLWIDLDPTAAAEDGGVFVIFLDGRVRVTWLRVPWFWGEGLNTVQLTLFTNGRTAVAYGDVGAADDSADVIVGVSPGRGSENVELVDYDAELPITPPRPGAVMEFFTPFLEVDSIAVAQVFYEHFQDQYDFLSVWHDFEVGFWPETADLWRNDVEGIGLDEFDLTGYLDLGARLQMVIGMNLREYPSNPNETLELWDPFSTLGLLGSLTGLRWMPWVQFLDADGMVRDDLLWLGLGGTWSFAVDSDASLMGGNDIVDQGDGTFTTVAAAERYCPLDQYLMGLIPAGQVPPFYFVENATGVPSFEWPQVGVTLHGQRFDLSVHDIIDYEGPRRPPAGVAPTNFRMAFVLLSRRGEPSSAATVARLDRIRRQWVRYFATATDGNGRMGTALFELP